MLEELSGPGPVIVGIDHGFSFSDSYFRRYGLKTWDGFLKDFHKHWPTDRDYTYVDDIREKNPARTGRPSEFRLTERRAKDTQSVFKFDGKGTVGKSTHSGVPWLEFLRGHPRLQGKLHFWPFDGLEIQDGGSVAAEVWPTLFRQMYHCPDSRTKDQHDAYSVARRLQETDAADGLPRIFRPAELQDNEPVVCREGWILGVQTPPARR